jgi:hypothetical protein
MKIFSILSISLLLFVGCANNNGPIPANLTPAYTANEVLLRVQELQRTVIALHDAKPSIIAKDKADIIVLFTTSTASIVQNSINTPDPSNNWPQVVKASWDDLNREYTPTDPQLKVAWAFLDVMLKSLVRD